MGLGNLIRSVVAGQTRYPTVDWRGRQLVVWILWLTIGLAPLYGIPIAVAEPSLALEPLSQLVVLETVGWVGLWLVRRDRVEAAGYLFHAGFLAVIVMGTLASGGMGPLGYVGGTLIVVTAGLLLGGVGAAIAGGFLFLWGCLLLLLGDWGVLPPSREYGPVGYLAVTAGVYLALAVLLGLVWYSHKRLFAKMARELVERREAEAVAAESERRTLSTLSLLRATIESTADGILVVDDQGKVSSWNQRFLDLWGIPPRLMEEGRDEDLLRFVTGQLAEPEPFLSRVRQLYETPEAVSFDILRFTDGRVYERYSQPQRLDGKTVGRVWSFRDVTERVQSAEQLRSLQVQLFQAQKLEAMGTLAGGVAHDFNNLLAAIGSHVEVARLSPVPDTTRVSLDEIHEAVLRARDLVKQILLYSQGGVADRESVSLNRLAEDTTKLLRAMIPRSVEVVVEPYPGDLRVIGHTGQLQQVLMNLGVNAWRAMGEQGGEVRIQVARSSEEEDGRKAIIAVSDTGRGISEEILAKIFEPFFTTRAHGEGTGLGLAMVQRIARDHMGEVTVESAPGSGSTFRVHLPLQSEEPVRSEPTKDPSVSSPRTFTGVPMGGGQRVLIVDDEPAILRAVSSLLDRLGYVVQPLNSPAAVLEALDRGEPADLLLTDLSMPGMTGVELAEAAVERRDGLRVVLMTGYDQGLGLEEARRHGVQGIVSKPFTVEEVAGVLGSVLADS